MADISNITVSAEGVDTVCKIKDKVARNDIAINRTALGYQRKNLLPYPKSIVKGGITFTCDENGYMTGSNKTSDSRQWTSANAQYSMYLEAGTYYFSSFAETVCTNSDGRAYILTGEKNQVVGVSTRETHVEKMFTLTEATTIYVTAKVYDGKVAFMIRYADITDDTYEPYKESVDERLTENKSNAATNRSTLGYQCKNLLKNTAATKTVSGITFTVNDDKSVTLNGTSTAQADFYLSGAWGSTSEILQKNKYITSIGVSQSSTFNGFVMHCINNTTSIGSPSCNYPSLAVNSAITAVYISVSKGYTFSNYKLYPMIRYADITDDTYEPYQPSVQEQINALEARIAALGG